jgi:amino acid transporter
LINDAGVVAKIIGCLAITAILLAIWGWKSETPMTFLLDRTNAATGQPGGFAAFASSLLVGAWCLTGFEGAADLAEETHRPRRTIPLAVLQSEISSGLGGLVMLVAFVLSIDSLPRVLAAADPLLSIFESRLSSAVMPIVMLVIFLSIFACGVASMAAATRLIFAMARDNMLPASRWLRRVDSSTQAPRGAIILVFLVSCVVVPTLVKVSVLSSAATVAAYLGYAGIVVSGLVLVPRPEEESDSGFSLGRWRVGVGLAALVWLVAAILALTLSEWEIGFPTARAAGVSLGVGFGIYALIIAPRIFRGVAGPPRETASAS